DAEGRPQPGRAEYVGEVDEDALRGLGPEIDLGGGIFDRSDEGPEHQVELTGFGKLAAIVRVARAGDLVGAEALVALLALDPRVGEVLNMTGRHPGLRVHDDAGVDADHVVAQLDHRTPPGLFDVVAQRDPQRPEVPEALQTAVNLTGLHKETATLRQRDQPLHDRRPFSFGQWRCRH